MQKIKKIYLISCWLFLIFKITTFSSVVSRGQISNLDKAVHFFVFAILAFLLLYFLNEYLIPASQKYIITIFIVSSLSLLVEYLQIYIPGRHDSIYDFFAGFFGLLITILIYHNINIFKPKILLHICCAACGAYVGQELSKKYRIVLYYYNPSIFPQKEYKTRLKEVKKVGKIFSFKTIIEKYNHNDWQKKISGHEVDSEGGERCLICYQDRLEKTAFKAKEIKIKTFASTLSVSPHKKADKISRIGNKLAKQYDLNFLDKDFKKRDGFKKASILAKKLKLYRQNYCGCEYSQRNL